MGTDLTKVQQIASQSQRNVQDLHGLDAVIPLSPGAAKRVGADQRTEVQTSNVVKRIEQHLTVIKPRQTPQSGTPEEPTLVLRFPQHKTTPSYSTFIWFVICVILPISLASVYYGFYASNQYATEFRFTVRDSSVSVSPALGGLMSMLGSGGPSTANNSYIVTDFFNSRQAVEELQKRINVVSLYSKPSIDWWSRFNGDLPIEKFLGYWNSIVSSRFDVLTGIGTAEVRAFSPQDALLVANTMVSISEELINKISNRSQNDAVQFAQRELDEAQSRLKQVRYKLTDFRNKFGVIDPNSSVAASNSSLIQTQRANLAQLETQLSMLQSQNLLPNAPAIITLKNQIKSTREQLSRTEKDVGVGSQSGSALSAIMGEYEQLNLEVQFAQAMVTSTMQALEQARANAAAQHLYITPYVRPTLPQSSTYPERPLAIAKVGFFAFGFWVVALMIVRSVRERFG